MSVFEEVAALAAAAHGCVLIEQLRSSGLSEGRIRTLVRTGFLQRRGNGLFTVIGAPPTWRQQVMVEVLRGGSQAVSSHRSTSALAALDRFRPGAIDVVSPRGGRRSSPAAHLHETCDLPGRDRDVIDGIPVTSVTRTLIDMGRYVGVHRLGSMLDDAVRQNLTSYELVHDRFRELARPGRNGIGRMRAVLEDRPCGAPAPGSDFESMVLRLLLDAGLPRPVLQHRVQCGDLHFLLDLAWPDHLLAVECEGFAYHQTPTQLAWDEMRRNRLQLHGWRVLGYTWITAKRDPVGLVAEVDDALHRG